MSTPGADTEPDFILYQGFVSEGVPTTSRKLVRSDALRVSELRADVIVLLGMEAVWTECLAELELILAELRDDPIPGEPRRRRSG